MEENLRALQKHESEPLILFCQQYPELNVRAIAFQEQYIHARNIAQERLEDALSRCVAFDGRQVTFAMHVLASEDPKSPPIRLHSLLNSLAALSGLEKHLRQIAENIVRNLVKPVLVERAFTVSRQSVDEDTQVLDLQSCPTTSLEACTDSLRSILQVINTTIASSEGLPENRDFLLSHIVPEIQQLLIKHVLTSSMPQTAEKGALAAFQDTCRVVADFEAQYLLGLNIKFEATVQEWVHHAGEHWANAVIQRSFAALRADVITSDYWNKTEKVDWLDDPNNSEDIERWERWLSDSAPTTLHQPQPKASTSKLPPSLVQAKPADTSYSAAIEADEDVAWKFEDQEHDEVQESQASVDNVAISSAHTSSGKRVEDSPDLDADDAWGFDDEPSEIEASEQPLNEDDTNAPTMRVNGHRKNTLSQSSSRSQGSQKGMLNIKGQDSQYISSTGGIDEDEDDGGWSFDADADLEATGEGEQRLEEVELAKPSLASPHKHSGHSRHSSIEDAWGWSRNPDPDEDKPIGKPTKVVVSKKLGAKGRNGSPTPAVSLKTDVESATSPATDTVPPQTGFQNIEKTTPSGEPKIAQAIPALAIESASESLKKEHTSLHVSLSAKRVAGTSLELSKAALTVASSS